MIWLVILAIAVLYFGVEATLYKYRDKFEAMIDLQGPVILLKTKRLIRLIGKIGKNKRLCTTFSKISLVIAIAAMVFIFFQLLAIAVLTTQHPPEESVSPRAMIGIPVLNPYIPVMYGVIGLIVAVAVHEFAHGIIAASKELKIKSVGILFLIIPIGAFVEPDEDMLKNAPLRHRIGVFAAGPGANLMAAFVVFIIFVSLFARSIEPLHSGVVVSDVVENGAAALAGIKSGDIICYLNGSPVENINDFLSLMNKTRACEQINITVYSRGVGIKTLTAVLGYNPEWTRIAEKYGDKQPWLRRESGFLGARVENYSASGVIVVDIVENSPADAVLAVGDIITAINGTPVSNVENYSALLAKTKALHVLNLTVLRNNTTHEIAVKLGVNRGLLGVSVLTLSVTGYAEFLKKPHGSLGSDGVLQIITNLFMIMILYISLPFFRLMPVSGVLAQAYYVQGPLATLPVPVFWFLFNLFYWVFWFNIVLGTTNALPALPLDGGYMLKDALARAFRSAPEHLKNKVVNIITGLATAASFLLILWILVMPRML